MWETGRQNNGRCRQVVVSSGLTVFSFEVFRSEQKLINFSFSNGFFWLKKKITKNKKLKLLSEKKKFKIK
jgi:hypothetical protein